MKKEDLQAQGLTEEQINFVFAENGKDIKTLQDENATLKAQNSQLENDKKVLEKEKGEKEKALNELQKNTITTEEYNRKIKEIESSAKKEHEDYVFNQLLDQTLAECKVLKNEDAIRSVKGLLDMEKISIAQDKKSLIGVKEQLEEKKKTSPFFFETKLGGSNPTEPGGNGTKGDGGEEISMASNFAKEANKSESQEKKSQFFN